MKLIIALLFISGNLLAHSGRTDSSGCHHDRKNGTYHCHRSEDIEKAKRGPASTKTTKAFDKKIQVNKNDK